MTSLVVSDRILRRNTGGNTTYAQNVYARLPTLGVSVDVRPAPASRLCSAIWEGLALPNLAKADEVIHFPADTGGCIRGAAPIVGTIHGVGALCIEGTRRPVPRAVWLARTRRLATIADRLITVSDASADVLAKWLGRSRDSIAVIPHGVDHERFRPLDRPSALDAVTHLGLPDRFALFLGNIEPRKNVALLADAWESAMPMPLVVAGRPAWDADRTLKRLRRTPNVIYLGPIANDDVAPLMNLAEIFLFPSLYEGFGLPVLEAMACGTPVIASDIPAIKAVAVEAAAFVPLSEPTAWRRRIVELAGDARGQAERSFAGLARAASFNWDASASAHAHLFHDVADSAGRRPVRSRAHKKALR